MTANDYRRLYGLPMVCYWFGKPIQNVDQRNEAIAHARAEIEKRLDAAIRALAALGQVVQERET